MVSLKVAASVFIGLVAFTGFAGWANHRVKLETRNSETWDLVKKQEKTVAELEDRPPSWFQKAYACFNRECDTPYSKHKQEEQGLLEQRLADHKEVEAELEQHRQRGLIALLVLLSTTFLWVFLNPLLWIVVWVIQLCGSAVFYSIDIPFSVFSICACLVVLGPGVMLGKKDIWDRRESTRSQLEQPLNDSMGQDRQEPTYSQPEQDISQDFGSFHSAASFKEEIKTEDVKAEDVKAKAKEALTKGFESGELQKVVGCVQKTSMNETSPEGEETH